MTMSDPLADYSAATIATMREQSYWRAARLWSEYRALAQATPSWAESDVLLMLRASAESESECWRELCAAHTRAVAREQED